MKTLSTVTVLAISGLMTLLIFTGSDSSPLQINTSNMAGISNVFNDIDFDLDWSDGDNPTSTKLDSCMLADALIGKNGISKCDS